MPGLYTRTGDDGSTFCYRLGGRVPKDHPVVELLGSLDEAVSLLGLARALAGRGGLGELESDLAALQDILFHVGVHVSAGKGPLGEGHVKWLEGVADRYYGEPLKSFVLPGSEPVSAAIHAARAAVRRAERRLVEASRVLPGGLDPLLFRIVNRASDALFAMAVYASRRLADGEEPVGSRLPRVEG